MANYFVDSVNGVDSDTGSNTSSTAYATLKYCFETAMTAGPANGDIVWLDIDHAETVDSIDLCKVNTSWDPVGDPVYVVCSDFDTDDDLEAMMTGGEIVGVGDSFTATGASGSNEPAFAIEWKSVIFRCNDGYLSFDAPMDLTFRRCKFELGTTINWKKVRFNSTPISATFHECEFDLQSSNTTTVFYSNGGEDLTIKVFGGSVTNIGTGTLTDSLMNADKATSPLLRLKFEAHCIDLSMFESLIDDSLSSSRRTELLYHKCKVHDTWANMETNGDFGHDSAFDDLNAHMTFIECDSANVSDRPTGLSYHKQKEGSIEHDTSTFYTANPANDGVADFSWRVTVNEYCNSGNPVGATIPLSIDHPGGDATLTLRFIDDDTLNGSLRDDEVWVDVLSPGHTTDTGSSTVGRYTSTLAETGDDKAAGTSSVLLLDTNNSWERGASALPGTEYKFEIPVNATEPGTVLAWIHFARPATVSELDTYNVNKLEIS